MGDGVDGGGGDGVRIGDGWKSSGGFIKSPMCMTAGGGGGDGGVRET